MDIDNQIIVSIFKTKTITTSDIIKKVSRAVEDRLPIKPRRELIIHTDRGTQFSSSEYDQFIKEYQGFILGSMTRANKPKDNAVAERFMRTFKEHKIEGKTFQEELFHQIEINARFRGYRKIFNLYVKSLNLKPNSKSQDKSPEQHDINSKTASMLMVEPTYSRAFSDYYGEDFRREEINKYKSENKDVVNILDEIAARRAEVVQNTPFDDHDNNIMLKVIDNRLNDLYAIIQGITRQYVEEAILPLQDMIQSIDDKINTLLPKQKRKKNILPLRDPIMQII